MLARGEINQKTQTILFWGGVAFLLLSLGFLILPTLNLGFVADDFFLLVPDRSYPLTQSPDELHRPLRNVIIRLMAKAMGIQDVMPYRLVLAGSFLLVLILLFLFTRALGVNRLGALAAVFVLAFFPKNHEVLDWFAAWQDLAAAAAVLGACLFFLRFRDSNRLYYLILSATAYLIALGFKETTAVIPALLVGIDFYRERSFSMFLRPSFWKAYIPFCSALLIYAIYFFSQSGLQSLEGKRSGGYYGFHGIGQVFSGLVRTMFNIALPYPPLFALKGIGFLYVTILLIESSVLFLLIWRLHLWAACIFSGIWVICTILPSAAFAGYFNVDRYLFIPMLGIAVFFGALVSAVIALPGKMYSIAVFAGVTLYTLLGIFRLAIARERFRDEGREAAMVIRDTVRECSALPHGSDLTIVNVTPVLSNGLSEALHAEGLSRSLSILRNVSAADPAQQTLVTNMLRCGAATSAGIGNRAILLESAGKMIALDAGCASGLVDLDRSQRPYAWAVLFRGK